MDYPESNFVYHVVFTIEPIQIYRLQVNLNSLTLENIVTWPFLLSNNRKYLQNITILQYYKILQYLLTKIYKYLRCNLIKDKKPSCV